LVYGFGFGGGGGGGAYSSKTYTTPLVAGAYSYYVGAGGAYCTYLANGGTGGNTIWNYGAAQDVAAGGGAGGQYGGYYDTYDGGSGTGGDGGLVLAGSGYSGAGGGYGNSYYNSLQELSYNFGGGGGGSGGPNGPGIQGGNATTDALGRGAAGIGGVGYGLGGNGGYDCVTPGENVPVNTGLPGTFPGGGGGGSAEGLSSGQGANGEIIVTYTQQAVPEPATLALLGAGGLAFASVFRGRYRPA
jgi:hypothetical protein